MIDSVRFRMPSVLLMFTALVPLGFVVLMCFRQRAREYESQIVRWLASSAATALMTSIGLWGSLFGDNLASSSTAGVIFFVVPILAAVAGALGYAAVAFVQRSGLRVFGTTVRLAPMANGVSPLAWIPLAVLGVLVVATLRLAVSGNDTNIAEKACNDATLHRVYKTMEQGGADSFSIPLFLAQNPCAPADLLTKMSQHKHPAVRAHVAQNRNTDLAIVALLKNDPNQHVRDAAIRFSERNKQ